MKLLEFYLLLFSLIILNSYLLNAQWEETSGPPHVEITSSLASFITDSGDTNLYAGTDVGGIFLQLTMGIVGKVLLRIGIITMEVLQRKI